MVRVKKRHLLFRIHGIDIPKSGLTITTSEIYQAIKKACTTIHGQIGGAKCMQNFSVKYFNIYTGIGYMTILHQYHKKLSSTLPFVNIMGKHTCTFQTLHLAATIKCCQRWLVKYHSVQVNRIFKEFSGLSSREKEAIESSIKVAVDDGSNSDVEDDEEMTDL